MTKKTIFYKKEGRKYVPVYEYDQELLDAYPRGTHVVVCYPGGESTRFNINPNHAAMIAAGRVAEDAISQAIYQASELKPKERPITPRQREAWEELKKAFGDEFFSLTFPSSRYLAEVGVKAMMEEADKLMTHTAVKDAYEKFLMVCELTKEQNNG